MKFLNRFIANSDTKQKVAAKSEEQAAAANNNWINQIADQAKEGTSFSIQNEENLRDTFCVKKLLKGQLKDNVKRSIKILAGMEGKFFF